MQKSHTKGIYMLFFNKKHSFKHNKKLFRKFTNRFSRLLPLIAAFTFGMFGAAVYYKNNSPQGIKNASFHQAKIEEITNQLNNEKDLTDSLSSKNYELKLKLKEALSKAGTNTSSSETTILNTKLLEEKQVNQKLTAENNRLKNQIKNLLAKSDEANTSKEEGFAKNRTDQKNRNLLQNTNLETRTEYNKVKMTTEGKQTEDRVTAEINRNVARNKAEPEDKTSQKIEKSTDENKNRTMKLKEGESLWNLSKRAYGKGIYYRKIINANPSITEESFKKLRPGTIINVPLSTD